MCTCRTGFGYDVHRLVEGRKLTIGGVDVPHSKGALGHSDADVLLHAITDALLGAAALGDIGTHFPDSDPRFKNMDSRLILQQVFSLIKEKNYRVGNIDTTVVLQQPKIKSYIPKMREQIAALLETQLQQVSVKASTTEHLGFIGKEDGIAAYAVVLLRKSGGEKAT